MKTTLETVFKAYSIAVGYFFSILFLSALFFAISSCSSESGSEGGSPGGDKGIGPVTSVSLGALDENLAANGKTIFAAKCVACHKIDVKVVGPALQDITKRRKPEWIMNQILNPTEMTQKDPVAKALLGQYIAQMANQNLTQDEARAVLEFFRQNDSK